MSGTSTRPMAELIIDNPNADARPSNYGFGKLWNFENPADWAGTGVEIIGGVMRLQQDFPALDLVKEGWQTLSGHWKAYHSSTLAIWGPHILQTSRVADLTATPPVPQIIESNASYPPNFEMNFHLWSSVPNGKAPICMVGIWGPEDAWILSFPCGSNSSFGTSEATRVTPSDVTPTVWYTSKNLHADWTTMASDGRSVWQTVDHWPGKGFLHPNDHRVSVLPFV